MTEQITLAGRIPVRSMGLKLLLVCALALAMSVPALFVLGLLMDRTHRASEVSGEIGQLIGGPQTFLGPVLAIPYAVPPANAGQAPERGVYIVFPAKGDATVKAVSEVRKRSLFKVPVYTADLDLEAAFDLTAVPSQAPAGAVLDWSRAEFLVGVSDPRGAKSDIVLSVGGKSLQLAPSAILPDQPADSNGGQDLHYFGAPAGELAAPGARFEARASLKFSGATRLAVLPYAKTTTLKTASDWPSPSFDGAFLPASSRIWDRGFNAEWRVPFVARGAPGEGPRSVLARLQSQGLGVSFVQPADAYQSVGRALKYAILFVGLVFLAYFLFETQNGRRVHPAQYVLIGLAQMVFYLLLLSLGEQIGFDWAFLAAAGATVSLISLYAAWVFESRRQGVVAFGAFSLLYGLIYVLLRLEDFALIVGSLASFAAIAAVMYFTRGIDWYGQTAKGQA
jgi:inner membrane protein